MADPRIPPGLLGPRLSQLLGLLLIVAVGVIGWLGYQRYTERYTVTRDDGGAAVTQIVSATFARASAIKVGTVSGTVQSTASDTRLGGILVSDKVIKAPYSVEYFVDVSGLAPRDYRWDGAARRLSVDVPEVSIGKPNIDQAEMSVSRTRGILVTRDAADALARKVSVNARAAVQAEARKPEHRAAARENARRALRALLAGPLQAARLEGVEVNIRFPDERPGTTEQWDTSRSINEVLANRR